MSVCLFFFSCFSTNKQLDTAKYYDTSTNPDTDPTNEDTHIEETAIPDTGTTQEPTESDEWLFREAVENRMDAETALLQIAHSDGFPIQTSEGAYLFGCLCGDGQWNLSGDFSNWEDVPMEQSGDLHWVEYTIENPLEQHYKFHQEDTWIADPYGRRYTYDQFGAISFVRSQEAHLEYWPAYTDSVLSPRDLHVWVPKDGIFTHMLFAHDGQNLFDPNAIWGGWRLQESLPENILVVGISNTTERMNEYTHASDQIEDTVYGGLGDEYASLVHDSIRTKMEETYGFAEVYGLMGSSLGGLISLYIAHLYPSSYQMAISLSGTLYWGSFANQSSTIITAYEQAGLRDFSIYIDSGGIGTCLDADADGMQDDDPTDMDNYCANQQMKSVLESLGYEHTINLWHWHEPNAPHNEQAWAERVWRPLGIFAEYSAE